MARENRTLSEEELMFVEKLQENMRTVMKRNGWGITKFCDAAGLSRSTVTPIYNCEAMPSVITLHRIAQTMHMSMSEAVGEVEIPQDKKSWYHNVAMIAEANPEVKDALNVIGRALADGLAIRAGKECITGKGTKAKKVRCIETGEVFSSIKDTAAYMGVSRNCLAEAAQTGNPIKGYHYEIVK